MRAFDAAWDLLKSMQDFQRQSPAKFVREAKRTSPYLREGDGSFAGLGTGYDRALVAGNKISTLAERNAVGDILREMGIYGAGRGFKNQPSVQRNSPLRRNLRGEPSSFTRQQQGLPPPTLQEQIEQASYYNAIDPQNDYTMEDHYARYPVGGQ
jgi:hypothetical protein